MFIVGHATQRFGSLLIYIYNRIKSKSDKYTIDGIEVDIYSLFNSIMYAYQALVSYGQAITDNNYVVKLAKEFGFQVMEMTISDNKWLIIDPDSYYFEDGEDEYEEKQSKFKQK